jgi:hypothetical protein
MEDEEYHEDSPSIENQMSEEEWALREEIRLGE